MELYCLYISTPTFCLAWYINKFITLIIIFPPHENSEETFSNNFFRCSLWFRFVSLLHTNDFIMSRNTYLTENTRVKHKVAKKFFEHNSIVAIKIIFLLFSSLSVIVNLYCFSEWVWLRKSLPKLKQNAFLVGNNTGWNVVTKLFSLHLKCIKWRRIE